MDDWIEGISYIYILQHCISQDKDCSEVIMIDKQFYLAMSCFLKATRETLT